MKNRGLANENCKENSLINSDGGCNRDEQPICIMPIKGKPYRHQIKAFNFAMGMFGMRIKDD